MRVTSQHGPRSYSVTDGTGQWVRSRCYLQGPLPQDAGSPVNTSVPAPGGQVSTPGRQDDGAPMSTPAADDAVGAAADVPDREAADGVRGADGGASAPAAGDVPDVPADVPEGEAAAGVGAAGGAVAIPETGSAANASVPERSVSSRERGTRVTSSGRVVRKPKRLDL